uniref:Transmembrane protein n=1 Tax=Rhizophora mucronata TaxID=61149 RepID=A0A2P2Q301_RHIMU
MPEQEAGAAAVSHDQKQKPSPSSTSCLKTLLESLKIFPRNKQVFFSIFALLALPLSFLLFSLSVLSYPIKSQILSLESLAALSRTRFEARHVWKESRDGALFLLRLKLLCFLPTYVFSLLAAITSVVSAVSVHEGRPLTLKAAFSAVRSTWSRPFATSIFIYFVLFLYSGVPLTLDAIVGSRTSPVLRLLVWFIEAGVEIYIMAVLGMGLVVSIVERRVGWDAVRVGSDLMEGRRVCGWLLSGMMSAAMGWIGWNMEETVRDGGDSSRSWKWTAVMVAEEGWTSFGLVALYGAMVVWGFVVTAVFYCHCRERHVVREDDVEGENINCVS